MSDANSPDPAAPPELQGEPGAAFPPAVTTPSAVEGRRSEPGSVHVLLDDDRTLVVLAGDVDAALAPDLLDAAAEVGEAGNPVRIDTRNVTFMDSTGVSFLARVAIATKMRPLLLDPPDHVRFLLDITAIADLVDVQEPPAREPGAAV